MNIQKMVNEIISGKMLNEKVKEIFLEEKKNIAILFATIKTIGNRKIFDEEIKRKLLEISERREFDPFTMGNYSIGVLAIASLMLNGVLVSEIPIYQQLLLDRKESIDSLVEYPNW